MAMVMIPFTTDYGTVIIIVVVRCCCWRLIGRLASFSSTLSMASDKVAHALNAYAYLLTFCLVQHNTGDRDMGHNDYALRP
jgi:cytochrome b561